MIPALSTPILGLALAASLASSVHASDGGKPGALAAPDEEFFEAKIRPLLVEQCYECHATSSKKIKGEFVLDSAEGLRKGGASGAVIVAGDPEQSRLVTAVRYTDSELKMPPKKKLSDAAIADLVEWVKRGAHDPRAGAAKGAAPDSSASKSAAMSALREPIKSEHWSFQPVHIVEPPPVRDAHWCANAIDRFVLARLEHEGFTPAPEADKRTLIRRANFDLLGLPPAPEEVESFIADSSSDAWSKVIERLLASPQYGVRWGRHWLDLARYADSNGLDENLSMSEVWRYRDWVIKAVNLDLPYDQFLAQQLAGDLLPAPASEAELADQLTATGFLVLGPKLLAEQDKQKLVMDVVDEQIDVTSKAFLGLTLSCARCHDHKFDPLSTRDYYALAGVFKSTSTLANTDFVSRWREVELAGPARKAERDAYKRSLDEEQQRVAAVEKRGELATSAAWPRDLAEYLLAGSSAARDVTVIEAEDFARANVLVDRETWGTKDAPIVRTGNALRPQFAEYQLTPPSAGTWRLEVRYAAQDSRPVRFLVDGVEIAKDALKETTGSWFPDTQTWHFVADLALNGQRQILRFERDGDLPHIDSLCIAPTHPSESSPLVPEVVRNFAIRLAKAAHDHDRLFGLWWQFAGLPVDGFAAAAAGRTRSLREPEARVSLEVAVPIEGMLDAPPPSSLRELAARYQVALAAIASDEPALKTGDTAGKHDVPTEDAAKEKTRQADLAAARAFVRGPTSVFAVSTEVRERYLPTEITTELTSARRAVEERKQSAPPPISRALGVQDGEALDVPVHVRGSTQNLGPDPIARGFPMVFEGNVTAPVIAAKHSGRLELTEWLTDPRHPLTARVMANRIWKGHFGEGIVHTPSNFGLRGDAPSHPELLDWLANQFVRGGWSIKSMHRLIMSSSAYRMSARFDAANFERDPENRLVWRMNRRRLDAECVRDALLATSGLVDLTLGGTLVTTKNGDYATNDQSANMAQYASHRRSVYLPIIRNAMYDLFSTFDYADPSMPLDARSSTTDANQALLLMNSPLVLETSLAFAKSLLAEPITEDRERIVRAWQRAYGRKPSAAECKRALKYVHDAELSSFAKPAVANAMNAAPEHAATQAGDAVHDNDAKHDDAARENAWQSLCQVLLASNESLYVE